MRKTNANHIGYMSDSDLYRQFDYIKKNIYHLRKNGFRSERLLMLQEEFCYFFREVETREARKKAHQEYLAQNKRY